MLTFLLFSGVAAIFAEQLSMVSAYDCTSGCSIDDSYVNDNWCDCDDCGDETYWTCSSCSSAGCPSVCGEFVECDGSGNSSDITTTQGDFTCDDGCDIIRDYVDDGWCDCSDCEDETYWTCHTCSTEGCPSTCGDFTECDGSGANSTYFPDTTQSLFICDDGCSIYAVWYDDSWCDCSQCEDEPNWTCDTCGGCPDDCGYTVECDSTSIFTTTSSVDLESASTTTTAGGSGNERNDTSTTTNDSGSNDTGDQGATLIIWDNIVAVVISFFVAIYFAS